MSFSIVVARYNEDVQWSNQFKNVIIYNKGKKMDNGYNQIPLNNVGREGHTYYKYICDNYEKLPEYTFFLQGYPFDHSGNIICDLTNHINLIKNKSLNIGFKYLNDHVHNTSLDNENHTHWQCKNIHKTWERVFGKKVGNLNISFNAGAQFVVSKKNILKRPKIFYENIVKILEYDIDPLEGYDIERFHLYILNKNLF